MRNAHSGGILLNDQGQFAAWNLGADYCAEHEWGIKRLQQILGISQDDSIFGIERRRVTQVHADYIHFAETKTKAVLSVGDEVSYARKYRPEGLAELTKRYQPWKKYTDYKTKTFTVESTTAWDEKSFIISVEGKENKAHLKELYEALVSGKAAVWLGGGGVFQNAGLVVGIIDRINGVNKQAMYDADKERYDTKQYVKSIGIEETLRKAGKAWFALSPGSVLKSRVGDQPISTKYDVMFFLNPQEQHKNNYGWFTVEELEQWADNKGPVIKEK